VAEPHDRFSDRQRVFGTNKLPEKKLKSIWELVWIAYNDKVLILLSIAAVISLAVGIPQSMRGTGVEWVEGAAIIAAIFVVVTVGAANDWQKEREFAKLNKKREDRYVKVIRSGKTAEVSTYDIIVGDVMCLEAGDMIPADGILIDGHGIKCNESSVTGESDLLRKTPGDKVYEAVVQKIDLKKMDPFIMSGSNVEEGTGTFLVTATGVHTAYGRTVMSLQDEGETTPLQVKLNVLADYIAKVGLSSGLILFVALFIKFLVRIKEIEGGAEARGQAFLRIFIVAVTIVVVAVPEGLPLAVTLALAFATTRMIKDNNLVRLLRACETMGNATTICSDKTGTLTQNKMSVVAATLDTTSQFGANRRRTTQPAHQAQGLFRPRSLYLPFRHRPSTICSNQSRSTRLRSRVTVTEWQRSSDLRRRRRCCHLLESNSGLGQWPKREQTRRLCRCSHSTRTANAWRWSLVWITESIGCWLKVLQRS
jgi:Ca2+-transporting ATPase